MDFIELVLFQMRMHFIWDNQVSWEDKSFLAAMGELFLDFLAVRIISSNAISPLFDASQNKNIGTTIRIGREIRYLPYAGFLKRAVKSFLVATHLFRGIQN